MGDDPRMDVLVIGCGVIGLSTAIRLQEAGVNVQIWTADLPQDSTSSVAAATWYPYKAYPEDKVLGWSSRSYEVFEDLARDPESGVHVREGVQLWHKAIPAPWWGSAVANLRQCTEHELPAGYRDGYVFPQPVIEMPVYLSYLLERFTASGGRVKKFVVNSLEEVAEESRMIINCAGLGARKLVSDDLMSPIRGQIVRVRNPGLKRPVLDEENPKGLTYIVPRSDDCVLGGTAEESWSIEPDPRIAAEILRRCTVLEPRLAEAEILEHKVGLRPSRSAVRLEREELTDDSLCVHNYGHGGAGVTLSWGCADETVELVRRIPPG
jgi:D-amino-acid oxidase